MSDNHIVVKLVSHPWGSGRMNTVHRVHRILKDAGYDPSVSFSTPDRFGKDGGRHSYSGDDVVSDEPIDIVASGVRDPNRGTYWEGESWDLWWVLEPPNKSDDELSHTLPGIHPEGGGGAGLVFYRHPTVQRTKTRVLVKQGGGFDI